MGKLLRLFFSGVLAGFLLLIMNHLLISGFSRPYMTFQAASLHSDQTGLILGTPKYTNGTQVNRYYLYRIRAAGELYRAGKVNRILVSGNNIRGTHREVDHMMADLQLEGIPSDVLIRHDEALRTYHSVAFAAKYFSETPLVIISQPFHNERALAMCSHLQLNARAYNAREPLTWYTCYNVIRELGARAKMQAGFLLSP